MQFLQSTGLRWTRFCVASTATALFTSGASLSAFAGQTHALQPGECLDSLARQYHVSVRDLIRVNHIENQDDIPDGRVLTIPPPLRSLTVEPTTHRVAHVGKDSVSIRLGPGLEYRRMNFVYEGDTITVTAEQDGWAQVEGENGVKGWMLKSLLRAGHAGLDGEQIASRNSDSPARSSHKPKHQAAMVAADEDRSRARKVARHQSGAVTANHKRHTQHQEPNGGKEEQTEEKSARVTHSGKHSRTHARQIAKAEHVTAAHRRHHDEDSEPAVTSHKRHAKRASEATASAARSQRRHHKSAQSEETQVAKVTHHSRRRHIAASGEQVAKVTHRRHSQVAEADAPAAGNDLVRTAYSYRGTPYVWGGERPGGFDCSGFTLHLLGRKGVSLPHSARQQFNMGHKVDKNGMKAGDLVFFHTVTPGISHVGMYVGNGKFVHASSRRSGGVRVDNLDSGYYSKAFRGARRMRKSDD